MTALIGRDREIAALQDALADAGRGGGLRIVRGPPGIGKTALLEVANEYALDQGFGVLSAVAVQSEAHLPFAGLHTLLHPVLDRTAALPAGQRSALHSAFGIIDGAPTQPFLVALAALELIVDAAARAPVLLLVDDAQWLDGPTADVLAFVARRVENEPVVLFAGLRDGYQTPLTGVGIPEVVIDALSDAAAEQVLRTVAPDLDEPSRTRVLREAAGTPLALLELPAALRRPDAARVGAPGALPLTARLEQAFAARLAEFPTGTRTMLAVAAADDSDLLPEVTAAATRLLGADAPLDDLLHPAVAAGLVAADRHRIVFRHPLVRSAVYGSLSAVERRSAHAALAATVLRQPDRYAWHLAAATLHPDEAVAAEIEAAADRARSRGGTAIALAALQRAAELTVDAEMRGRRLVRAAELAWDLGDFGALRPLVEQADRLVTGAVDRARLHLLRHSIEPGPPGDPAAISFLLDAGHGIAGASPDLATMFVQTAAMQGWWADPGPDLRRRVLGAAEQLPLVADDARLLSILSLTDPRGRGDVIVERTARLAPATCDADDAYLIGAALNVAGAFDLSAAFLARAVQGLREQGRVRLLPQVLTQQAWTAISAVDWRVAVPAVEEAVRLGRETAQPLWVAAAKTGAAMLAGLRGSPGEAENLASEAEAVVLPLGASAVLCGIQLTRGVSALAAGEYATAFDQLWRMFDRHDPSYHHFQSTWAVGDLAEAARHSDQVDRARDAIGAMTTSSATPNACMRAGLLLARPLLAGDATAEQLFRAGLQGDLTRWPLHRARLLLEYGSWLRRQRRVVESRAPLRAAREAFDALGVVGWAKRARAELRASGEDSRTRAPGTWAQLSPQELQIAQMAALGLSNKEIGQRLFLSHRTVGSHLYRIFPKLGVTARAQLHSLIAPDGNSSGP